MVATIKTRMQKGDLVEVITGAHSGKQGRILRVDLKAGSAYVEKLNIIKRHTKPNQKNQKGGIITKEAPIKLSNLMVYCGSCSKPVKIKRLKLEDGSKTRVCAKCNEQFG